MSNSFFSWRSALINSDLKAGPKLVALVLATYMNDHGESCFPTQETIAKNASRSVRDVQRAIKELSKTGWIEIHKHGFAGQKWQNNEYKIALPGGQKGHDSVSPPSEKGPDRVSEGGDNHDQKDLTQCRTNSPFNSPITKATNAAIKRPLLDTTKLSDDPVRVINGLKKTIRMLPKESPTIPMLEKQIEKLQGEANG